jgi:hypothetical protein
MSRGRILGALIGMQQRTRILARSAAPRRRFATARQSYVASCVCLAAVALAAGCFAEKRVIKSASGSNLDSASGLPLPPPGVCVRGEHCIAAERGTDKVDLLFMIDNSNSMREEQDALLQQIPALIEALSSGDLDHDGTPEFGAVRDLHLGAVTSDMGLIGIEGVDNCQGIGDDGLLQHQPQAAVQDCKSSYPPFLSFTAASADKPKDIAHDFACIATMGTGGCGFEQQLEAPLKALWPSKQPLSDGDHPEFLADASGKGSHGHGDTDNAGFLRSDPMQGLSVVGVILITDEEDGSSSSNHHFTPPAYLDPSDELAMEPLNLRDFYHPEELYPVERYIAGFKALRPGHENLVVFGAITGVPPDLVDAAALAKADRSAKDRSAFYEKILDDPRMKERIDPGSMTTPGTGNLLPACDTVHGKAYPARRIVETARGFGANGFIQSICEDNYQSAVGELAKRIVQHVATGCVAKSIKRQSDALAPCNLRVVLAKGDDTRCAQLGKGVSDGGKTSQAGSNARTICDVAQVARAGSAADDGGTDAIEDTNDWYYDDFSEAAAQCATGARVAMFGLELPQNADLYLDCE